MLTESNSSLPSGWWSREEHGPTGDSALLDHFQDHACRLSRLRLPNHSLRVGARFQSVIKPQTADM